MHLDKDCRLAFRCEVDRDRQHESRGDEEQRQPVQEPDQRVEHAQFGLAISPQHLNTSVTCSEGQTKTGPDRANVYSSGLLRLCRIVDETAMGNIRLYKEAIRPASSELAHRSRCDHSATCSTRSNGGIEVKGRSIEEIGAALTPGPLASRLRRKLQSKEALQCKRATSRGRDVGALGEIIAVDCQSPHSERQESLRVFGRLPVTGVRGARNETFAVTRMNC